MRRLVLPALLLAVAVPAVADAVHAPMMMADDHALPTTLTITAEGRIDRAPDVAELSGGVVTQAPTAAAALAANATRMTSVIAAIRRAGIADRDIQTTGLNLQPQYKYGDNQPPVLTGYQVNNTVSLKIRKLTNAGTLVDALVAAGANQINGPTFRVDDAEGTLDAARRAAVATARSRAELYATATGMHVARIRSIVEGSSEAPAPRPIMMMARAKADDTPVAPGEVSLGASVTVVFELN